MADKKPTKKLPKKEKKQVKKKSPKKEKKPAKKPTEKPTLVVKKERRVIIESMGGPETTEIDENKYSSKLKVLLNKIKGQNSFSDDRIRFGWRN